MWNSRWVAMMSRLLKIIGLFCKRALYKRRYSAKETCNLKEPTNRSHPILRRRGGVLNIFTYISMGCLRWVGSLKSEVSFVQDILFYRALFQKRPIILRSLRIGQVCLCFCCLRLSLSPTHTNLKLNPEPWMLKRRRYTLKCKCKCLFYRSLLQKRPIIFVCEKTLYP